MIGPLRQKEKEGDWRRPRQKKEYGSKWNQKSHASQERISQPLLSTDLCTCVWVCIGIARFSCVKRVQESEGVHICIAEYGLSTLSLSLSPSISIPWLEKYVLFVLFVLIIMWWLGLLPFVCVCRFLLLRETEIQKNNLCIILFSFAFIHLLTQP